MISAFLQDNHLTVSPWYGHGSRSIGDARSHGITSNGEWVREGGREWGREGGSERASERASERPSELCPYAVRLISKFAIVHSLQVRRFVLLCFLFPNYYQMTRLIICEMSIAGDSCHQTDASSHCMIQPHGQVLPKCIVHVLRAVIRGLDWNK